MRRVACARWLQLLSLLNVGVAVAILPIPNDEVPPEGRTAWSSLVSSAVQRGVSGGETLRGLLDVHALVLRVEFADTLFRADLHPQAHYEDLLFSHEHKSVAQYYDEISYSALRLTGDVHRVVHIDEPITRYTGRGYCDGCFHGLGDYPFNSQGLVEDLVANVNSEVDFSEYDRDGDGFVDALFVVYAGIGNEDRPGARRFHSHQWHTVDEPLVDGVAVSTYVLMSEWGGIGGFAHEMAHLFGVPDLYDLDGSSMGLGDWSLMATGAFLGEPRYSNPAHPDAWTRIALGFVSPASDPTGSLLGTVALEPVETSGRLLRLWTGRASEGAEYFLVETRSRMAGTFDRDLPGDGLLIYHVDDDVPSNRNEAHYRVALEQADGLYELEEPRFYNRFGDSGDPFPGDSLRTHFASDSQPGSLSHAGQSTGVSLVGIQRAQSGLVSFELGLADTPILESSVGIGEEIVGNGDLLIEGGETRRLRVTVKNTGLATTGSQLRVSSTSSFATITPADGYTLGAIGESSTIDVDDVFEMHVCESIPSCASEVAIVSTIDGVSSASYAVVGTDIGLRESFEDEPAWSHRGLLGGDAWHFSSVRSQSGTHSAKCGSTDEASYETDLDCALFTPPILLGGGSTLLFAHWLSAESAPPRDAYDGARVEISTDARSWDVLEPVLGYSHHPVTNSTLRLQGSGLFSGESSAWRTERFDLSAHDGQSVWLRFRFASDDRIGAEGWYVDDVEVQSDGRPVAFVLSDPDHVFGAMTVKWSVVEVRDRFDGIVWIERRSSLDDAVLHLGTIQIEGTTQGRVADRPMLPREIRTYRLIEQHPEGDLLQASLNVTAPGFTDVRILGAAPNPFRSGGGVFRVVISPSDRQSVIRFYDVGGRTLRTSKVPGWPSEAPVTFVWDGRTDTGEPVAPGVYYYQVDDAAKGRVAVLP